MANFSLYTNCGPDGSVFFVQEQNQGELLCAADCLVLGIPLGSRWEGKKGFSGERLKVFFPEPKGFGSAGRRRRATRSREDGDSAATRSEDRVLKSQRQRTKQVCRLKREQK